MSNPGFSVSELIQAVDWTIKLIIDLNQAGDQVKDLRKDLETSRDQLNGLEHELRKTHHSINHRAAAFKSLRTDLFEIINDTFNFLQRLPASNTGVLSKFRRNFRWVLDSRYEGTVKGLQERIVKVERCIDRELQLLSLYYHRDAYEARKAEETRMEPRSPVSPSEKIEEIATAMEKETRPAMLGLGAVLRAIPIPSTGHDVVTISKLSSAEGRPGPWVSANAPPSPPPSPPMNPVSPPMRSMTSMTGTTMSGSTIRTAPSIRRASTLTNNQAQFTRETLQTNSTIKAWFYYENRSPRDVPFKIKSIAILRDTSGCFRGVIMTRPDGKILKDEISTFWSNLAKYPLPVHSAHTRDLKDADGQAKNCIKFLRDKKEQTQGVPVPKYYSFTNDEDYALFQTKIVGLKLIHWIEVKSVTSAWSKTTPLCENQFLQLWEKRDGEKSIHFLRNGKDLVYSHHLVSSLRIKKESAKELKLVFVPMKESPTPGSVQEQEKRMEFLVIVFSNPKEMPMFLEKAKFLSK